MKRESAGVAPVVLDPTDGKPATAPGKLLMLVSVAVAIVGIAFGTSGWVPILDSANLAFHEAGHLIFGLLGETLGLYGGTLGQLVFPTIAVVAFWRRDEIAGMALGWIWLFENGLNISRYMADARAQALPLVGGGEHDWFNILSRWHALHADTMIARLVAVLCWAGILGVWAWAFRRWTQRERTFNRRASPKKSSRDAH